MVTAIVPVGPAPAHIKACQAEVRMAAEVWQYARPKGRPPLWAFRVTSGDAVVFEAAWVAIRYSTQEDATWLAGLVDRSVARGAAPGHPGPAASTGVWWDGDAEDDCRATVATCTPTRSIYAAHATAGLGTARSANRANDYSTPSTTGSDLGMARRPDGCAS